MGVPDSHLHDLEHRRLELEGNILKLQESLYHWRTWEAEYDGLKEEINDLNDDATTSDFLRVGRDFSGSLVSEDEVKVILGEKQGVTRTRQQVVDLISRRIDYVRQNVATMEKRLRAAENEVQALDSAEQLPLEPTADFAMTEIMEELDEDGNVIASSTSTPGDKAPELLEALKKAGVKDIPDIPKTDTKVTTSQPSTAEPDTEAVSHSEHNEENKVPTSETVPFEATKTPGADHEKDTPASLESSAETQKEHPVTDVDESPEDTKLRHEMLQYGLNEVGAVVAELELDEDASDISVDDEYEYEYDDDGVDEEEDEFGRSTRSILDEDYHRQMRELEGKLNARGLWNMGKNTGALPDEVKQELEQPATVRIERTSDTVDKPVSEKKPKKKVAFADDLDIAPSPKPPAPEKRTLPPKEDVPTILDSIIERTEKVAKTSATTDAPRKASRFKNSRKATENNTTEDSTTQAPPPTTTSQATAPRSLRKSIVPPPTSLPLFPAKPTEPKPFSQPISDITEKAPPPQQPQGPEGKILADTLVERPVSKGAAVPPEPDELDEQLHRKEIATEFYRMRNRMIQQNGGFVGDEPEMVPIETEDAPKRVSKFKSARMR